MERIEALELESSRPLSSPPSPMEIPSASTSSPVPVTTSSTSMSDSLDNDNSSGPDPSPSTKSKRVTDLKKSRMKAKPEIMVFRPTWEEFKDFNSYIGHMEDEGAHLAGIAKVIPPPEYKPRKSGCYDDIEMTMEPIRQNIYGKAGQYTSCFEPAKTPLSVRQFKSLAQSRKYAPPPKCDNFQDLERDFWRNLTYKSPLYGADISGTLMDKDYPYWNFNKLGSILDLVKTELKCCICGVNSPYLYFGMWKSAFAWHTEDVDLYSINYLHFGEPKSWYGIPPSSAKRFEDLAVQLYPESSIACKAFMRHKSSFISPRELKANLIPYGTMTQNQGEIMITFPCGYHSGFNHGYNIAEAVNFATPRWVEYGKRAILCRCKSDTVRIDMEPFVKQFQPDRYDLWMTGQDYGRHPEQTTGRMQAAPKRWTEEDMLPQLKKRKIYDVKAPRHGRPRVI